MEFLWNFQECDLWFMIILKVTRNQGFNLSISLSVSLCLSLEDTFLEKPQVAGGGGGSNWPPRLLSIKKQPHSPIVMKFSESTSKIKTLLQWALFSILLTSAVIQHLNFLHGCTISFEQHMPQTSSTSFLTT